MSYHLERYYRHRREVSYTLSSQLVSSSHPSQISRLYQPLSAEDSELVSDSDSESGVTNGGIRGASLLPTLRPPPKSPVSKTPGRIRLGNVWDESEELFGIGEEEDGHDGRSDDTLRASHTGRVKITVTSPS